MRAGLRTEATKLVASLIARVTTVAVIAGVVILAGSFLFAIRAGNAPVIARLGPAATDDWAGYLSVVVQITSAGGLGAFAIVLGWMFGREFTQGTISGLFALPVSRATLAAAKLLVFAAWGGVCALLFPAIVAVSGLAFGLGLPAGPAMVDLLRLAGLIGMNALVAIPIAVVATLTRSILGAVAFAVALVVIAQVSVIAGVGAWNPIALPALWAIQAVSPVSPVQLLLLLPYAALSAGLTLCLWRRLQLDR